MSFSPKSYLAAASLAVALLAAGTVDTVSGQEQAALVSTDAPAVAVAEVTFPTTTTTTTPPPTTTTTTVAPTTTTTTAPPPPPTTTPPPPPPPVEVTPATGGTGYNDPANPETWDRLAGCEATNNWHINTGNGYYGGLQFSLSSWQFVGGTGYPHEHSRETQIAMGQRLHAEQGWGAWPHCSSKLGYR